MTSYPAVVFKKCNQVAQEEIWRERVSKEVEASRNWEGKYGYTALYDSKGQPKVKPKKLPDKIDYFSSDVPKVSSCSYGHSLKTSSGVSIGQLELSMTCRKKKSDVTVLPVD